MRGADGAPVAAAGVAALEAALRGAPARARRPSSDWDLNPGAASARPQPRPAAVLVGVDVSGPAPRLLLTKRSAHLRHHPGQIALPGGKLDGGEDPAQGALREAAEEVGLPPGAAEVLGLMPPHDTVTGFAVTPVLALIRAPFDARPQEAEVAEAFFVPFAHLADPASYRVEGRRWGGVAWRYYAVPWGPHYVWGATARILRALADALTAP